VSKEHKEKRIQSRQWQIIAPADWSNLESIKDKIKLISRHYYFVLHDKDVDELTGNLKKPHWHYLFSFGSARDLTTVTNYFTGIENLLPNSYEKIGSIVWAKRYLVHADDPQKAQYNISDVETNDPLFKELFISKLGKIEELEHVKRFMLGNLDNLTFAELFQHYEGQMVHLTFQSKMSLLMRMRDYYDRHSKYSFKNENGDGFTPINPNDPPSDLLPF